MITIGITIFTAGRSDPRINGILSSRFGWYCMTLLQVREGSANIRGSLYDRGKTRFIALDLLKRLSIKLQARLWSCRACCFPRFRRPTTCYWRRSCRCYSRRAETPPRSWPSTWPSWPSRRPRAASRWPRRPVEAAEVAAAETAAWRRSTRGQLGKTPWLHQNR